jgi:hypothetical protein
MTCSRCSRCRGARASSCTSSAARRCFHACAGTRRPLTETSNPPNTRISTRDTHQASSPRRPRTRIVGAAARTQAWQRAGRLARDALCLSGAAQRRAALNGNGRGGRARRRKGPPACACDSCSWLHRSSARAACRYGRRVFTPWRPRVPQCGFPLATWRVVLTRPAPRRKRSYFAGTSKTSMLCSLPAAR